jgi:hypothetical protein
VNKSITDNCTTASGATRSFGSEPTDLLGVLKRRIINKYWILDYQFLFFRQEKDRN